MKLKIYLFVVFSIIIGTLIGIIIFKEYDETKIAFSIKNEVYFLQQGVYKDINNLNNNTNNISNFIYFEENGIYKVYVGITTNKKIADKLKNIYNERNIDIYVKQGTINDVGFIEKLKQYDNQINETNEESKILDINLQVLSEYKMVMESEN